MPTTQQLIRELVEHYPEDADDLQEALELLQKQRLSTCDRLLLLNDSQWQRIGISLGTEAILRDAIKSLPREDVKPRDDQHSVSAPPPVDASLTARRPVHVQSYTQAGMMSPVVPMFDGSFCGKEPRCFKCPWLPADAVYCWVCGHAVEEREQLPPPPLGPRPTWSGSRGDDGELPFEPIEGLLSTGSRGHNQQPHQKVEALEPAPRLCSGGSSAMPTVAWVRAIRGTDNNVCSRDNDVLESIFDFFESLRIRELSSRAYPLRIVSLPGKGTFKDWFIPCTADAHDGRFAWHVPRDKEKEALFYNHCEHLCRLGIPAFFNESCDPRELMKLFVPLEAYVKEGAIKQLAGNDSSWRDFKDRFVSFAAERLSAVVGRRYGGIEMLVAVFDSSGYSPSAERWKISFRMCFPEISIGLDQLLKIRRDLVQSLESGWNILTNDLKFALEPVETWDSSADNRRSFWDSVFHEKSFRPCKKYDLVYCDSVGTAEAMVLPERRPLLPYSLLLCRVHSGVVTLEPTSSAQRLNCRDWALLGSPRSHASKPTPMIRRSECRSKPAGVWPWVEWTTEDGRKYVENQDTREVQWWDAWASYQWEVLEDKSTGRRYYHNAPLQQTVWALPAGAQLQPGQLLPVGSACEGTS